MAELFVNQIGSKKWSDLVYCCIKKAYLAILIVRPLPWINIDIIFKQRMNTLSTAITNTQLEKGNLVRGSLAYLSAVM